MLLYALYAFWKHPCKQYKHPPCGGIMPGFDGSLRMVRVREASAPSRRSPTFWQAQKHAWYENTKDSTSERARIQMGPSTKKSYEKSLSNSPGRENAWHQHPYGLYSTRPIGTAGLHRRLPTNDRQVAYLPEKFQLSVLGRGIYRIGPHRRTRPLILGCRSIMAALSKE